MMLNFISAVDGLTKSEKLSGKNDGTLLEEVQDTTEGNTTVPSEESTSEIAEAPTTAE